MTKKRVYLAGPFFSPGQKERLDLVANLLSKNPTIDADSIHLPGNVQYPDAEFGTFEWQTATFQNDIHQIDQADIVVAVIDYQLEENNNEADSGTVWECGYAAANRKPVILVRQNKGIPLNLMLAGSYTAMFDGLEDMQNLTTYDFKILQNKYVDLSIF
ncbi:nucleoside 2-deoxyribosyltransferase [Dellaglioa carnosa]|uniref:nucleoside 2-deoxyribosyltransferase n=1 Tax=Dellaglioa carnosa TaxID=2995136 RepID=UPI0022A87E8C|nr:nucleoside 2-deoxyribosyltransferase [Dellaglioa carnosa]MCZ2493526.1 nucleoside 2-deoxyribosyltransferase [Dellaglioa carnosa]